MGIIPAGRGQDAAVVGGVGHLLADFDLAPIDRGKGSSINQAVDERGVGGSGKSAGWDRQTGWPAASSCGFPGRSRRPS